MPYPNIGIIEEEDNAGDTTEPSSEYQSGNNLFYDDRVNTYTLSSYIGGSSINMNDNNGPLSTNTTYYSGIDNNAFHNTPLMPYHDSMASYNQYHQASPSYDEQGGGYDGMRVASPEPTEHMRASPVPARNNNKQTLNAAPRTKYENKSTKRKKGSTDSILSTSVDQGSDPEFDNHTQRPRRSKGKKSKHRDERKKDASDYATEEEPWTGIRADDPETRKHRIDRNVHNPKLPGYGKPSGGSLHSY